MDKTQQIETLSEAASYGCNIKQMQFIAQLVGCPCCIKCGYVKSNCKCNEKENQ